MPAPAVQAAEYILNNEKVSAVLDKSSKSPSGYMLLTGFLPKADDDSRVFIICGDSCFEAFLQENGGFAAFVPDNLMPDYVLSSQNGVWQANSLSFD
ncbi:MAG: hypothetical protein GX684_06975 [Ruminococcaceae bacterium]|nr:hypothetical protein [Oscillospiraceae bacterium]